MANPEIKVIEHNGERIYTEIPDDLKHLFISVTEITGTIDRGKSEGLMYWASGLSFDYVRENFFDRLKVVIEQGDIDSVLRILDYLAPFYAGDQEYHYKKAKSYHQKKSQEHKDIGTYTHEAAEAIFRSLIDHSPVDVPVDDEIEKPINALLKWFADNDVRPVLVESRVWAMLPGFQWGWRGRLDVVAFVNGILTTIDLKAANGIYYDGPLQVAAYDYAYDDMVEKGILETPGPTDASAILRLDKETGMPEYKSYSKELTLDYFREFGFYCCGCHAARIRKDNEQARKKLAKETKDEEPPY